MKRQHFAFIDGLRALAALWVMCLHLSAMGRLENLLAYLPYFLRDCIFYKGGLGVSIFFALSGFVIAHSLRDAKITPSYFFSFLARRQLRLAPPYYASIGFVLIVALVASYVKQVPFQCPSASCLLAHLFYVQTFFQTQEINDVFWTLCYEMQFYLVFCALCGFVQKMRLTQMQSYLFVFFPLLAIGLVYASFFSHCIPGIFLLRWHQFFLGVLAYFAYSGKCKPWIFFLVSFVTVIVCGRSTIMSGFISVFLFYAALFSGGAWLSFRFLRFLGKISYSMYLTHNPVHSIVLYFVSHNFSKNALSEGMAFVFAIIFSILFAYLFWAMIERPSHRLAKNLAR